MPDYYHGPALVLTALLLPAFGFLYLRSRNTRTLLWFLAFGFALLSMGLSFAVEEQYLWPLHNPWITAASQTAMQLASALFLGSLSQLRFRFRRFEVLYVIPYIIPLMAASTLLYGVFRGVAPADPLSFIFPLLFGVSFSVGMIWGTAKGSVPSWLGVPFSGVLGCGAIWLCESQGPVQALKFAGCVNILMALILLAFSYRRVSPGIFLSVIGFTAWSLPILRMVPWVGVGNYPLFDLDLTRVIAMSKVVAALGMIVLSLEDELNANKAARERERRARLQLEAYTNLMLTRRRVEDFDHQAPDICEIIVKHSRFTQAALILRHDGRYRLAGTAGIEMAIAKPLAELVKRIQADEFLAPGETPSALENSMTRKLDLTRWLLPGDDLERLRYTSVLAVPMWNRNSADGALLLSGLRAEKDGIDRDARSPTSDDLLPIEMLVTRLQATRSQTMLFEKLIDAEKYAGLGQLASNVTQQLNNPLTVVLGYATLLEESTALDSRDRKAVNAIASESRRIRGTLDSLSRISRAHADAPSAVSVSELITDMEQLYRTEFLLRSIDFQVHVAPGLPRALCGAQQLRQAVLHCLQYAMGAVQREDPEEVQEPKTVRLEAASEGNLVQISVMHSGPGFSQQERAFDPFTTAVAGDETEGLGLSLCATILRDQNGRASAVNLEPRGAAIILEVQAA